MENRNKLCNHKQCRKTIFVQSVPLSMTKIDLVQYFSKFGKLQFSKVMCDYKTKRSRGLAVIQYVNLNDTQKLLQLPTSNFVYRNSVMKPMPSRCRFKQNIQGSLKRKFIEINYENCDPDEEDAEECYFNRLPDELINHIFSFFDFKERIRLERVCKRWRCVNTTLAWENMRELNFEYLIGNVDVIALSDEILIEILLRCGSLLHKIDFSSCYKNTLTKAFPINLATYCPNLESVNFSGTAIGINAMKIFSEHCKKLKSVSLENCDLFEKSIWFLLKTSQLQRVDLTGNCKITGNCFRFMKDSPKTLILNGCVKLSPISFKFLENKVGICDLRLSYCRRLTPESLISVISSLESSLTELHLEGHFEHCDESDYVKLFSHCKNLEHLNLEKNFHITENVVSIISKKCPLLCSLNLSATRINDACLISFKNLSNLRDLSINYMKNITDEGLKMLSVVEKLERVELRDCKLIGDSGCIALLINCNRLKYLDVSCCSLVTNTLISEASCLARSSNEKLEIIAGGTGITTELNNNCMKVKLINLCPTRYEKIVDVECYDYDSDDPYFDG